MFLHGAEDTLFRLPFMKRLFDRLTCKKVLKIYPGVDHFVLTAHAQRVIPDIVAFIEETCGALSGG